MMTSLAPEMVKIEFSDPKLVRKLIPNQDLRNFIMGRLSLNSRIENLVKLKPKKINSEKIYPQYNHEFECFTCI